MAIDRRQTLVLVITVVVFAVIGTLLTLAWMYPLTVPIMARENLSITDVQFDANYLTLSVKNICEYPTTISEVLINQTSTSHTFPVSEQISAYGQASIRISFNWSSGSTYQVGVETAKGNHFYYIAVAPYSAQEKHVPISSGKQISMIL
jgi:hypothetical protein